MVDALREAWRVLCPRGVLADLRPVPTSRRAVELVLGRRSVRIGEIDGSGTVVDDLAADRAVAALVTDGWFVRQGETRFEIDYCWETVEGLTSFIEESRRLRLVSPTAPDLERIHRRLESARPGRARLRYRRPMMLAVYNRVARPEGQP